MTADAGLSGSQEEGPAAIRAVRAKWRKRQIVAAASELIEQHGFHETSVNDVAAKAGVSVGTIYQYLPSKEDILLLVIIDILDQYRERVPEAMVGIEDPVERLLAGFDAYCRIINERHSSALVAYRESKSLAKDALGKVMELEIETTDLLASCVRAAADAGALVADIQPSLIASDFVMLAHMWALKHWHLAETLSIDEYVESQARLMLRGIVRGDSLERYERLLDGPQHEAQAK